MDPFVIEDDDNDEPKALNEPEFPFSRGNSNSQILNPRLFKEENQDFPLLPETKSAGNSLVNFKSQIINSDNLIKNFKALEENYKEKIRENSAYQEEIVKLREKVSQASSTSNINKLHEQINHYKALNEQLTQRVYNLEKELEGKGEQENDKKTVKNLKKELQIKDEELATNRQLLEDAYAMIQKYKDKVQQQTRVVPNQSSQSAEIEQKKSEEHKYDTFWKGKVNHLQETIISLQDKLMELEIKNHKMELELCEYKTEKIAMENNEQSRIEERSYIEDLLRNNNNKDKEEKIDEEVIAKVVKEKMEEVFATSGKSIFETLLLNKLGNGDRSIESHRNGEENEEKNVISEGILIENLKRKVEEEKEEKEKEEVIQVKKERKLKKKRRKSVTTGKKETKARQELQEFQKLQMKREKKYNSEIKAREIRAKRRTTTIKEGTAERVSRKQNQEEGKKIPLRESSIEEIKKKIKYNNDDDTPVTNLFPSWPPKREELIQQVEEVLALAAQEKQIPIAEEYHQISFPVKEEPKLTKETIQEEQTLKDIQKDLDDLFEVEDQDQLEVVIEETSNNIEQQLPENNEMELKKNKIPPPKIEEQGTYWEIVSNNNIEQQKPESYVIKMKKNKVPPPKIEEQGTYWEILSEKSNRMEKRPKKKRRPKLKETKHGISQEVEKETGKNNDKVATMMEEEPLPAQPQEEFVEEKEEKLVLQPKREESKAIKETRSKDELSKQIEDLIKEKKQKPIPELVEGAFEVILFIYLQKYEQTEEFFQANSHYSNQKQQIIQTLLTLVDGLNTQELSDISLKIIETFIQLCKSYQFSSISYAFWSFLQDARELNLMSLEPLAKLADSLYSFLFLPYVAKKQYENLNTSLGDLDHAERSFYLSFLRNTLNIPLEKLGSNLEYGRFTAFLSLQDEMEDSIAVLDQLNVFTNHPLQVLLLIVVLNINQTLGKSLSIIDIYLDLIAYAPQDQASHCNLIFVAFASSWDFLRTSLSRSLENTILFDNSTLAYLLARSLPLTEANLPNISLEFCFVVFALGFLFSFTKLPSKDQSQTLKVLFLLDKIKLNLLETPDNPLDLSFHEWLLENYDVEKLENIKQSSNFPISGIYRDEKTPYIGRFYGLVAKSLEIVLERDLCILPLEEDPKEMSIKAVFNPVDIIVGLYITSNLFFQTQWNSLLIEEKLFQYVERIPDYTNSLQRLIVILGLGLFLPNSEEVTVEKIKEKIVNIITSQEGEKYNMFDKAAGFAVLANFDSEFLGGHSSDVQLDDRIVDYLDEDALLIYMNR